jgi:hypothetical protein
MRTIRRSLLLLFGVLVTLWFGLLLFVLAFSLLLLFRRILLGFPPRPMNTARRVLLVIGCTALGQFVGLLAGYTRTAAVTLLPTGTGAVLGLLVGLVLAFPAKE